MTTRADLIEAMARADALFDGRIRSHLSELGKADRQRYLDRSAGGLAAISSSGHAIISKDLFLEMCRAEDLTIEPIAERVMEDDGA